MPIKEFECEACKHKFEDILSLHEANPVVCPKCGKGPLKSILGSFRIAGVHKKSASDDDLGAEGGMPGGGGFGDDMGGMNGDMGGEDFGGDVGGGDFGAGDMGGGDGSDAGGDEPPDGGEDL